MTLKMVDDDLPLTHLKIGAREIGRPAPRLTLHLGLESRRLFGQDRGKLRAADGLGAARPRPTAKSR